MMMKWKARNWKVLRMKNHQKVKLMKLSVFHHQNPRLKIHSIIAYIKYQLMCTSFLSVEFLNAKHVIRK